MFQSYRRFFCPNQSIFFLIYAILVWMIPWLGINLTLHIFFNEWTERIPWRKKSMMENWTSFPARGSVKGICCKNTFCSAALLRISLLLECRGWEWVGGIPLRGLWGRNIMKIQNDRERRLLCRLRCFFEEPIFPIFLYSRKGSPQKTALCVLADGS